MGFTFIPDISNITGVRISNLVRHNLGATIWKSNSVLSSSSITISVLILGKVGSRVIISNSIAVLVNSWLIIGRLWVVWSWLVDNWSWVVWSWLVHNWGWVVDWGWVVWSWFVHNWSRVVWS